MAVDEKVSAPADLAIGELVARISDDTVRLVRDEIRLAQAEMIQKAKAAGVGAGMFGGAGICRVLWTRRLHRRRRRRPVNGAGLVGRRSHRRRGFISRSGRCCPRRERKSSGGQGPRCQPGRAEHPTRRRRVQARTADMNASEGADDPVEALRTDIAATRSELAETVNELSVRLNPKKRVGAVTQGVTETTKQAVGQAQDVTKDTAAKVQDVAKVGITRGRQLIGNRERQLLGLVLVVGLLLGWRLWKQRR